MSTPTYRAPTPADVDALVELHAAVESHDGGEDHQGPEDLLECFENPLIVTDDDWLVAELDGRLVGSTLLWPRAPADGEVDLHVLGSVHPEARGKGIGSTMLERMLDRIPAHVARHGAEHGADLRPVVRGFATDGVEDADRLLTEHGFRPTRWSFLMQADLSEGEEPALPEGYALSTWEGIDADEARAAHNLAFGGFHPGFTPWDAAMWAQFVTGSHAYRPALSLVARDASGEIAAYVQNAEHAAVAEATGVREVFVAKVGTTPDHRRHGLASVLLEISMRRAAAVGIERATLEVEAENPTGALGVYERAGFETVLRYRHYER